jgi:hypothetical protein
MRARPGWLGFLREARWLNGARASAYAWMLALFMGSGLMFDWVSLAIGHHPWGQIMGPAGKPQATDFLAFWAAGRQALTAGGGAAYDLPHLSALEHATAILDPALLLAFFYPPTFLLLCLPFAALPYFAGFAAFVASQAVVFGAGLARILPRDWPSPGKASIWGSLPILAFPGMLMNAATGQNGFWSASCFAWALVWLESRPAAAGAALGMLVIKPHLALVVPLGLAAAGRWRAVLACAATAAAWMALSWLILGIGAWHGFFAAAPAIREALESHREDWGKLQSVFAAVRIGGASLAAGYGAQAVVSVCVMIAVVTLARRRPGGGAEMAALAAAAMLCTPHILDYDLAVTGVPLAWLAGRAANGGWLPYEKVGAGVVFLWPLVARAATSAWGLPVAPLILAGLLVLVFRRAWRDGLPRAEAAVSC